MFRYKNKKTAEIINAAFFLSVYNASSIYYLKIRPFYLT